MAEEKEKKDKETQDASINIDLGLGKLFKGIGNFVDLVSDMAEKGEEFREKMGEFQGEGDLKDVKGVYGFSIKTGIGGQPTVESFGNVKETPKGPVVEETREPIVDLFEEDETVQVVAEMPGISKASIKLEADGDVLKVAAESGSRKYAKEVLLPSAVEREPESTSFKNGILEARFKKK